MTSGYAREDFGDVAGLRRQRRRLAREGTRGRRGSRPVTQEEAFISLCAADPDPWRGLNRQGEAFGKALRGGDFRRARLLGFQNFRGGKPRPAPPSAEVLARLSFVVPDELLPPDLRALRGAR